MLCGPSLEDTVTVCCLFDAKLVDGSAREELDVELKSPDPSSFLRSFSFLNRFVKDCIVSVSSS